MKKNWVKNGSENFQLFLYAFLEKDFISPESPILTDLQNINFWSRIETLSGFIEVVNIAVYNHLVRLSLKYGLDGIFSMVNLKNSS